MSKFSVSMCVYWGDNPDHFKIAVESVVNQTLVPDEVILVVDGPVSKEIDDIIAKISNNSIFKIIRLKENMGHGNARKIGLENCKNNLVAIMDSDDISQENRFELQINAFNSDDTLDVVGGIITEFIDLPENIIGKRMVPFEDSDIKCFLKKRCPMNLVTVMFKKDSINKVGGFIDWYCEEDYYLWIRMAMANMKFLNLNNVLVNVRVGNDMYNRRGGYKYFKSELKLQKYMKVNNIIGLKLFVTNVIKRFIVQVMLPVKIRGYVFRKFAREK